MDPFLKTPQMPSCKKTKTMKKNLLMPMCLPLNPPVLNRDNSTEEEEEDTTSSIDVPPWTP
jgi:hypothetical protein